MAERALARIDLGAVRAQLRPPEGASSAAGSSSARWSRPTATATAPTPARLRRWPAAPTRLAVATAREAAAAAAGASRTSRLLTMGALTAGGARRRRSAAGSEVAVWREGFRAPRRRPRPRPGPAGPGPRQARQRHGPARQPPTRRGAGAVPTPAPRTPTSSWPASGPTSRPPTRPSRSSSASSSRRFEPVAEAVKGEPSRGHRPRRQQRRRVPRAALPLRHGPLRDRRLRSRPVRGRTRSARGLEPGALAALLRRRREALRRRRQRRLRADLASAADDTWVGVLPIGYGDGVRRGLSNNAEVLVGGRRYPLVGTVSMDNVTIDLGPETDVEPGDAAVLIGAPGRASRSSPRSWRAGWGRSTTR